MGTNPPYHAQDGNGSGFNPSTSYGVWGDSDNGDGLIGSSNSGYGVIGSGANGVSGASTGAGVGVFGNTSSGTGVQGNSFSGFGIWGTGGNAGVTATNTNNNHAAYLASGCCAAWFTGDVVVTGTLSKGNNKFQIDQPLDPANKYLFHSAVESSEMKNVYDGIVILDANGEAMVDLPSWFEPLNTDFRYQLTSIGAPGPNLYIAEEVSNNRFKIAGGMPSMKVSWQVTGIRQDAWAKAHPMQVEEDKSDEERGYYMHPELHGAPEEKSIGRLLHPH